MECVILETSRIYCSVPSTFNRELSEETTLGGVGLERGMLLNSCWLSIFYNPDIFEDPLEFIPERWEREEYKQKRHIVELNFSAGPRSCLGKNLSLIEMKVMVVKLMKRY